MTGRAASPGERPRLLVLRALGLGDFLTGVPAMRALADSFPAHHRILAAPAVLAPLARLTRAVDELAPTEPLEPLARELHGCAVGVNLHGRGPASHRVLLDARPDRLIAWAHPGIPATGSGPRWTRDEHEVHRWCRLLEANGIPADPARLDLALDDRLIPQGLRGATLIHPGAASQARRWPAARFVAIAKAESGRGRRVLVTGGPSESDLALSVGRVAGIPAEDVYAGRTDLLGLAGLVAAAGRVVCGDTGVAHLATALRTPSVILFGPASPRHWGPPADRPWHRALRTSEGARNLEVPGGHLNRITVDEVLDALADLPEPVGRLGDEALSASSSK
ncbi:MAG: glycosyltransferase family 9 protein [Actinomycetota bacterium]|nr:glycosyltransferase family 9 protein [Actinomycetota bacterium]